MNNEQAIVLYQPMLQQIAMKIVGSMADAEDIVHDTFVRWLTTDKEKIKNTKAYLIKAVTNNCLNHIDKIKRKKDELLEDWHLSSFIDQQKEKDFFKFDLENEVSAALQILHKKLEPIEKSVFVLREVFNVEYEEIQQIVDRKKENCRKLFSRAKEKLSEETSKIKLDFSHLSAEVKKKYDHPEFLESFKNASFKGNISDLIGELKRDISTKFNNK